MFKLFHFLGLFLVCFFASQFDGRILAEDSFNVGYQINEELENRGEFENLVDGLSVDESIDGEKHVNSILDPFTNILDQIVGAADISYILYARPGGVLGSQLNDFWNAVKAAKLKNPPVLNYPPHVTLTGFFTIKKGGDPKQEDRLITALQFAIDSTSIPIPVQIGNQIKENKKSDLDYIPIKSPVLHALAVDFLDRAGVSSTFIRSANHISLRQDTQGSTTRKVKELENQYIHLTYPSVHNNTNWTLFIYKKTGGTLEILYSESIVTQ